jgi:predicted nucleic acid-binding Zn ribbon protein
MGKSDPRPMPRTYHCSVCSKGYAMDWACNNHEKLCKERERSRKLKETK